MEDYSLALALFDYVPVAISTLGMVWLADLISRGTPARRTLLLAAVALIASGGISKASWKLLWVLTGQDYALLNNLLFILMAPGFILMACHLLQARRAWRGAPSGPDALRVALPLIVLLLGASFVIARAHPESRAWFFLLLGTAAIANITISISLIRQSWRLNQKFTAGLFALSIALTLSLSGLARISPGVASLQWIAEALNTFAHATSAWAIFRLRPFIPSSR